MARNTSLGAEEGACPPDDDDGLSFRPDRPIAPEPIWDACPPALRALPIWTMWRYERKGAGWTKPPYRPDGWKASLTRGEVFSFDKVRAAYGRGGYKGFGVRFDGVGFVLPSGVDGLDIDGATTAPLDLKQWAIDALDPFRDSGAYIEWSVGRNGIHVLGRCTWKYLNKAPVPGDPDGAHIERYQGGKPGGTRYFTFSGHVVDPDGENDPQADVQDAADALDAAIPGKTLADDGEPTGEAPEAAADAPDSGDDLLLVKQAREVNPNFSRWHDKGHDRALDGESQNEIDMDYMTVLARAGCRSLEQMCRIFDSSVLHRDVGKSRNYTKTTAAKVIERAVRTDKILADMLEDLGGEARPPNPFTEEKKAGTPFFKLVDLRGLATLKSELPRWWWDLYVPEGEVTLLGGHGGTGKSFLAGMLAVCVAAGKPCLGRMVQRGTVGIFSAEDPGKRVKQRLATICRCLEIDPDEVWPRLHVIDATDDDDHEPILFGEQRIGGIAKGVTTPVYDAMARWVADKQIELLVIDNCSDVYAGDEIARAQVRAFVRKLVALVRGRGGAVLLLGHVDKSTSRSGGKPTNDETYSGSTAWHNSVRSRLFLTGTGDGTFDLHHHKSNLGRKRDVLHLVWPEHGVFLHAADAGGPTKQDMDEADTVALLGLIEEFTRRGEFIATAPTSKSGICLLKHEEGYPAGRKPDELHALLREAERAGRIARVAYRNAERKPAQRWEVQ